jgi:hypothetical protein
MASRNTPIFLFFLGVAALAAAGCLAPDAVPGGTGGTGGDAGTGGTGGTGGDTGGGGPAAFDLAWARSYGVDSDNDQRARSVSTTPARDILLTGEFRGSFTMDPLLSLPNTEGLDAFVAQLDPSGQPAWLLGFSGLGEQRVARALATADGGFVVAGSFTQSLTFAGENRGNSPNGEDGFVAAFDADQELRWLVRLDGPGAQAVHALALSEDGHVFIAGTFDDALILGDLTVTGDADTLDFFVAKLDPAGAAVWATSLGGDPAPLPPGQPTCHLAAGPDGGVHIAGNFTGTVFLDQNLGEVGPRDLFVARLDAAGAPVWGHALGAVDRYQRAAAIAVDAKGRTLLAGDLQGEVTFGGITLAADGSEPDALVALFDPAGEPLWARRYGSVAQDHADAATFDAAGDLLVAGRFRGSIHFGSEDPLLSSGAVSGDDDIFLARLLPDGEPLAARSFGANDDQTPTALAVDADGDLLLTGYFRGAVDFGGGALDALQGDDVFAVKLRR